MRPLFVIVTASLLLISCSGGNDQPAQPVLTGKSLFEEVKEQTVRNPNDAEAWYHLADLYERAEMYREEVDALNKVVSLKPDRGYAYVKLGGAYSRLERHQEAIRSYKTAIKYSPQNPLLYNNLAVAYGKVGKTDEEIRALEKAISLRPRYATARYNLGVTLLRRGDREGALKQYREIEKFDAGIAAALKKEIDVKRK